MSFSHPDQMHSTFADAFASGDVDALLDLYETGAVQLQQDGRVLAGPDSFRSVFVDLIAAGVTLHGDPQKAMIADDIALTSTRYEFEQRGENGERSKVHVVTAEVSRRQSDGTWRVVIDAPAFA